MGDPLDSALSRSLGRGLSEELRELAEFGLGGESTQMPQPMNVEEDGAEQGVDMLGAHSSGLVQSWPLHSGGGARDGFRDWAPSQFGAAAPAAASGGEAASAGPAAHMPVVITTYQGRWASRDGADGAACSPGHQQHHGNFGGLSGGSFDSGGGGGPSSSDSPPGADAEERRRTRRRTLNRESAKRARNRQRTQLEEAQAQVLDLGAKNTRLQEAVKRAEAERDAAAGQLAAARAQLAASQRETKPTQRPGAASPVLARLGTRGSDVGSSAGSGASEQFFSRLSASQLPPRAPDAPKPYGDTKPYSAPPVLMPPPPPQPPNIPRILPPQGASPTRRNVRHRQQLAQSPTQQHLRSASDPAAATAALKLQWSQPAAKAASQPVPHFNMSGQPCYVVSTGIPTPAPATPPPPRFQVPPQQLADAGGSSAAGAGRNGTGSNPASRPSRRSGNRSGGTGPASSPFSDMSDSPFRE